MVAKGSGLAPFVPPSKHGISDQPAVISWYHNEYEVIRVHWDWRRLLKLLGTGLGSLPYQVAVACYLWRLTIEGISYL